MYAIQATASKMEGLSFMVVSVNDDIQSLKLGQVI